MPLRCRERKSEYTGNMRDTRRFRELDELFHLPDEERRYGLITDAPLAAPYAATPAVIDSQRYATYNSAPAASA